MSKWKKLNGKLEEDTEKTHQNDLDLSSQYNDNKNDYNETKSTPVSKSIGAENVHTGNEDLPSEETTGNIQRKYSKSEL